MDEGIWEGLKFSGHWALAWVRDVCVSKEESLRWLSEAPVSSQGAISCRELEGGERKCIVPGDTSASVCSTLQELVRIHGYLARNAAIEPIARQFSLA
jgi:hypothetical protein